MSENQFNAGDVVVVKSGGPELTVDKVENNVFVKCFYWSEEEKAFKHITIMAHLLDLVKKVD